MWRTSCGQRTLEGAEARLFAMALHTLAEDLEVCENNYDVGLEILDRLTYGQKVSLLSIIAAGLMAPYIGP